MLGKLFSGAALGWWGRRLLEWVGLGGSAVLGIVQFYNAMPVPLRGVVDRVMQGHWQDITLGALVPFVVYVGTQVLSFRATTKPQIVTSDGIRTPMAAVTPTARESIEIVANAAAASSRPGVFGRALDWLRR